MRTPPVTVIAYLLASQTICTYTLLLVGTQPFFVISVTEDIYSSKYLNTFDDILRLNGYPENSIEQTNAHKILNQTPNLTTQIGHSLRSLTSLNDLITRSLTFSEKKTSQYALLTNPTPSGKPYPTPPRNANALETTAPSPTRDYVCKKIQSTSSHVTAAVNNILVALHESSTTA